jgi:carbamoylphosphate synthase large subunit
MAFQLAQSKGSEHNPVSICRMTCCGLTFFEIAPRSDRKSLISSTCYKQRFEALKILKNLMAEMTDNEPKQVSKKPPS